MQFSLSLSAGVPASHPTHGRYFLLMDTGAASSVQVRVRVDGQVPEEITTAKRGLKAVLERGMRFSGVDFLSAVDTVVTCIISDGVVDISLLDGANVNATIVGLPVAVSNDRGSPGNPVYINGAFAGQPVATAIDDDAPVAVPDTLASLATADANRIRLVFTNTGANPAALGGPGLTWAHGAILLQPGDSWVEDTAPNLDWHAICGAGLATTVAVQRVIA